MHQGEGGFISTEWTHLDSPAFLIFINVLVVAVTAFLCQSTMVSGAVVGDLPQTYRVSLIIGVECPVARQGTPFPSK